MLALLVHVVALERQPMLPLHKDARLRPACEHIPQRLVVTGQDGQQRITKRMFWILLYNQKLLATDRAALELAGDGSLPEQSCGDVNGRVGSGRAGDVTGLPTVG